MKFKKVKTIEQTRKVLIERKDNALKRRKYLRMKRSLERQYPGIRFIYIDETYIHINYMNNLILISTEELSKDNFKLSKGNYVI